MRRATISAAFAFVVVLAGTGAWAQNQPNAFCVQDAGTGTLTCNYASMAQCEEALKGKGGQCVPNPQK